MITRAATALTLVLVLIAAMAAPAVAVGSRVSLSDMENDLMCVACHTPLAVAQSPEAYAEKAEVQRLIARGLTKSQIEQAMVADYGPQVLGLPPAHGFNLTVYIVPPAIVVAGLAILAFTLPRWKRRARARPAPAATTALSPADARRLDDDLARHT